MNIFWMSACVLLLVAPRLCAVETNRFIAPERMQAIYDEVKTPFKYGIVIEPPPGKKWLPECVPARRQVVYDLRPG